MDKDNKQILKTAITTGALILSFYGGIKSADYALIPKQVEYKDFSGDGIADIVTTARQGKKQFFLGQKEKGYTHLKELDSHYMELKDEFQRTKFVNSGIESFLYQRGETNYTKQANGPIKTTPYITEAIRNNPAYRAYPHK